MSKSVIFLSFLLGLVAAIVLIPYFSQEKEPPVSDTNVILISIDTLRADHLGCYGYKIQTPAIDGLSRDSVLFKTAIAQAPSTEPSHASIFTSLIPVSHGAFLTRQTGIHLSAPTLTQILKAGGFRTASFNGGGQLDKKFGFDRGFEIYDSFSGTEYSLEKFSDKVEKGKAWISSVKNNKFFLFLHSYDIHVPYAPEKQDIDIIYPNYKGPVPLPVSDPFLRKVNSGKIKLNTADIDYIKAAYDAEIRSVDRGIKSLMEFLKNERLYNNTLIILTADHGEEFGEHGKMGWHSHTLFDELLKVPLIMKLPGQEFEGTVIENQVRSIDILPTVLSVLNINTNAKFQGISLFDLIQGGTRETDPYAISQKDRITNPPTSARTNDWKLYKHDLYDLKKDPAEKKSVAESNTEIKDKLREAIEEAKKLDQEPKDKIDMNDESVEQLKTLGYL